MTAALKGNSDGSGAIQTGGVDAIQISASQVVTIPQNLTVAGTLTASGGISGTGTAQIQPITASVSGNALTVTLNPTTLTFRSATLTDGTVNTRTVSNAISMTVSSGSTLGTVSAQQSRIVVLAIDNAGTVELAVVNISGGNQLDETNLISTTAEGGAGAADSANVIYSTTARTNVAYRVVGFVQSTQATAGTWATAPSTIQGVGGQALTAMSSIGYGQTWQTVTRTTGTTYYNTTGKPIMLGVLVPVNTANIGYVVVVSGVTVCTVTQNFTSATDNAASHIIIPVGASYVLTLSSGSFTIIELR